MKIIFFKGGKIFFAKNNNKYNLLFQISHQKPESVYLICWNREIAVFSKFRQSTHEKGNPDPIRCYAFRDDDHTDFQSPGSLLEPGRCGSTSRSENRPTIPAAAPGASQCVHQPGGKAVPGSPEQAAAEIRGTRRRAAENHRFC